MIYSGWMLIRKWDKSNITYFLCIALLIYTTCSFSDAEKNPKLHARWLENVKKNAPVWFNPRKDGRLCSEHFSGDMVQQVGQRMMLLPDVVPRIFQSFEVCECIHADFKTLLHCSDVKICHLLLKTVSMYLCTL